MRRKIEEKLLRLTPLIYFLLIAVGVAAMTIMFVIIIKQQRHINNAAKTAKTAVSEIQTERQDSIKRNCENQNGRNHDARKALQLLLKKAGVKPKRRKKAAAPVITLINALAPKQDCAKVVRAAVHTHVPFPSNFNN